LLPTLKSRFIKGLELQIRTFLHLIFFFLSFSFPVFFWRNLIFSSTYFFSFPFSSFLEEMLLCLYFTLLHIWISRWGIASVEKLGGMFLCNNKVVCFLFKKHLYFLKKNSFDFLKNIFCSLFLKKILKCFMISCFYVSMFIFIFMLIFYFYKFFCSFFYVLFYFWFLFCFYFYFKFRFQFVFICFGLFFLCVFISMFFLSFF